MECDDKNNENGDGCDENCKIESNFECVYNHNLMKSDCYLDV
jgi:hypothetical protein